jgi:glutaredoxin
MMKNKIEIFTLPKCAYCKTVKEYLKEKGIDFVEKPTAEFQDEWNVVAYLTGMSSTPTIVWGEEILIPGRDYKSPENLVGILENRKTPEVDSNRYIVERIKSMNYNIYTAFTRIGDVLNKLQEGKDVDS